MNQEAQLAKLEYINVLKQVVQHMNNSIQRLESGGIFCENVHGDYLKPLIEAERAYKVQHYMKQAEDSRVELIDNVETITRDGQMYLRIDGDRGTIKQVSAIDISKYLVDNDVVSIDEMVGLPMPMDEEQVNG